jgi:integrase/recombinase XerD
MIDAFLQHLKSLNRSEATVVTYKSDLNQFQKYCEENKTPLADVTREDVSGFILTVSRLGKSTQRRKLSAIKSFYQYLEALGTINKSPVSAILHSISIKQVDVTHYEMATEEDFEALYLACFNHQDRLIALLIYWMGLRMSELCSLTRNSILTDKLRVIRKNGKVQDLLIPDPVLEGVRNLEWSPATRDNDPLFPSRKGGFLRPDSMSKRVKKLIDSGRCVTPGITPHSFRRACARRLYDETKNLLYVRDYLGHSDSRVTERYIGSFT